MAMIKATSLITRARVITTLSNESRSTLIRSLNIYLLLSVWPRQKARCSLLPCFFLSIQDPLRTWEHACASMQAVQVFSRFQPLSLFHVRLPTNVVPWQWLVDLMSRKRVLVLYIQGASKWSGYLEKYKF